MTFDSKVDSSRGGSVAVGPQTEEKQKPSEVQNTSSQESLATKIFKSYQVPTQNPVLMQIWSLEISLNELYQQKEHDRDRCLEMTRQRTGVYFDDLELSPGLEVPKLEKQISDLKEMVGPGPAQAAEELADVVYEFERLKRLWQKIAKSPPSKYDAPGSAEYSARLQKKQTDLFEKRIKKLEGLLS
jgi:hypothetical protein